MLQHERIRLIKELLAASGEIMLQDVSQRFDVSKVTARKDLDAIIRDGFAERIRGGAIYADKTARVLSGEGINAVFENHCDYLARKRIAERAAENIADGDTIFLGSGMTCSILAELLKPVKSLTVITNNISALPFLLGSSKKVMALGGEITSVDDTTYFSWTENPAHQLNNLHVNKAFTSCTGLDLKAGMSVDTIVSTYVYRCIPDIKGEWYVLADRMKFNKIGLYSLTFFDDVDFVISDDIPKEYLQQFAEKNIAVQMVRNP